jgi:hypothetical protein
MAAKTKQDAAAQEPGADKAIERVRALISLATGGSTEEEARSSALQAVRLMKEQNLTVVPQAAVEEVKRVVDGAQALMKKAKAEANQKLMIGLLAGAMFGKKLF